MISNADAESAASTSLSTADELDRSFEARYGDAIVSRGIATLPALLIRWQSDLRLKDEDLITIATILSFYSSPAQWPSVSIDKMMKWRGVSRAKIQKSLRALEGLGYLRRSGRDPRHGNSYFFNLSGLLERLESLAAAEAEMSRVWKQQAEIRQRALRGLSAGSEGNREQKQRTENNHIQSPEVEDANSVRLQKPDGRELPHALLEVASTTPPNVPTSGFERRPPAGR